MRDIMSIPMRPGEVYFVPWHFDPKGINILCPRGQRERIASRQQGETSSLGTDEGLVKFRLVKFGSSHVRQILNNLSGVSSIIVWL